MSEFDPYEQWLGIPPAEQPPDHYRLLGIPRFVGDPGVIQDAADQRMASIRVYQTGPRGPLTQKLLNELSAAKLCLLNPYSKSEYDASLAAAGYAPIADTMLPAAVPAASDGGSTTTPAATLYAPYPSLHPVSAHGSPDYGPGSTPMASLETVPRSYARQPSVNWILPVAILSLVGVAGAGLWWVNRDREAGEGPANVVAGGESSASESGATETMSVESGSGNPNLIVQEPSGFVAFPMDRAELQGDMALQSTPIGTLITGWKSDDDQATWQFKTTKLPSQGIFRVRVSYQAAEEAAGASYVVSVDGEAQQQSVRARGRLLEDEFYLAVKRSGVHELSFSVRGKPPSAVFGLKIVELSIPQRP